MQEFYEDILPPNKTYLVATMPEGGGPKHSLVSSVEFKNMDLHCFHSLGGYDDEPQDVIYNPSSLEATQVKAFAFDLDVGKAANKYVSYKGAIDALVRAIQEKNIPQPRWVVSTGGGLHFYYTLPEPLNEADWKIMFSRVKAKVSNHLKTDAVVATLPYRLLRAVNTFNVKSGYDAPKLVEVIGRGPELSLEDLDEWFPPLAARPATPLDAPDDEVKFAKIDAQKLVGNCKVVFEQLRTGGEEATEPVWRDMGNLCAQVEGGAKLFHRLSNKHPDYTKEATDSKYAHIAQNMASSPVSCEVIRENLGTSSFCEGCSLSAFKNPIIGILRKDSIKTQEEAPISEFLRGDDGMLYADGQVVSAWFDVAPSQFDDSEQAATLLLTRANGATCHFRTEMLASDASTSKELHKLGINCELPRVARNYLKQLGLSRDPVKEQVQWGWSNNFDSFYAPNGMIPENKGFPSAELNILIKRWAGKQGTVEKWIDAIQLLQYPGQEPFLMSVLASLGSPLLSYLALENGAIISLPGYGGAGKSTSLRLANSVWGQPLETVPNKSDTPNALRRKTAICKHLPFALDEVTMLDAKFLKQYAFDISGGVGRGRLSSKAKLQAEETWQLISIMTANHSVHSTLITDARGEGADLTRVLELPLIKRQVLKHPRVTPAEGADMVAKLQANFGHFGEMFIQYMLEQDREAWIRRSVKDRAAMKAANPGFDGSTRYYESLILACYYSHLVAKRLMPDFPGNPLQMYQWMQEQAVLNQQKIDDLVDNRLLRADDFWNAQIAENNIVAAGPNGDYNPVGASLSGFCYLEDGLLKVPKEVFEAWLQSVGLESAQVLPFWARTGNLVNHGTENRPKYVKEIGPMKVRSHVINPLGIILVSEDAKKKAENTELDSSVAGIAS